MSWVPAPRRHLVAACRRLPALDIAADVVLGQVGAPGGPELAAVLTATAGFVRSGDFREYTICSW